MTMLTRRTPLKRTPFKRREGPSVENREHPRAKATTNPCAVCRKPFTPQRPMQAVCGPACARKSVEAKKKAERATDRAQREAMKSLRELLAEAQTAVNAFIRLRDAGKPCICCRKPFEPQKPGGSMDAGHYLARSIAPQHRFNPDNIFGQRKNCNRPGGTTRAAFRAGVIERIGIERLEALEADNTVHKWTREEVRAIRDEYRAKARDLAKQKERRQTDGNDPT